MIRRMILPVAAIVMLASGAMLVDTGGAHAANSSRLHVGNGAELQAVLAASATQGVIELLPGNYGALNITDVTGRPISIVSANPRNPARFTAMTVRNSADIAISDVVFDGSSADKAQPFLIVGSQRITLSGLDLAGPGYTSTVAPTGLALRLSSDVTVLDSEFTGWRNGLWMKDVERIRVQNNDFHLIRSDGIHGGGWLDVVIEGNLMSDFHPAEGDHPDGVQIWTTQQAEPTRRVTIRSNAFLRGKGGSIQGIFVSDQLGTLEYEALTVEDNLVLGQHYHGVALHHARGTQVSGNIVASDAVPFSWIRLREATGVVSDNQAQKIDIPADADVQQSGNRILPPASAADLAPLLAEWLALHPRSRAARAGRDLTTYPL